MSQSAREGRSALYDHSFYPRNFRLEKAVFDPGHRGMHAFDNGEGRLVRVVFFPLLAFGPVEAKLGRGC